MHRRHQLSLGSKTKLAASRIYAVDASLTHAVETEGSYERGFRRIADERRALPVAVVLEEDKVAQLVQQQLPVKKAPHQGLQLPGHQRAIILVLHCAPGQGSAPGSP